MDVAAALLLAFTARVSLEPRDERHPFGHSRAEPLGALGIAVLAAGLAFEVERSAVLSLLGESELRPDYALLFVFGLKVLFRGAILLGARGKVGAVYEALAADARNDLLLGAVAVLGFLGAKLGAAALDAWLAIPVGLYIGHSGLTLARENVDRLMGAAPAEARLGELRAVVVGVTAEFEVVELRAHHLGSQLAVEVTLRLPGPMTLTSVHELTERVKTALELEDDVIHAVVRGTPE
jgi:cation diffusion facilitator family transporter